MSPRGVWGCSPKQLQSLRSLRFYLKIHAHFTFCPLCIPFIAAHISLLSNSTALGSCSCLSVYPGAFHTQVLTVSPGGCAFQCGSSGADGGEVLWPHLHCRKPPWWPIWRRRAWRKGHRALVETQESRRGRGLGWGRGGSMGLGRGLRSTGTPLHTLHMTPL